MEGALKPREQGDIGELSAMQWLASKGARVYLPLGHSPDVDLVADVRSRLIKVQVKTSTCKQVDRFAVQLATRGGNQSWNGVTKHFHPGRFDFLFALVGDGRRWFIPSDEIEGSTGINLGGPKYSQHEIERGEPLGSIDRADAALDLPTPRRGSADVGESGQPVKLVPRAEWVRIPPPPSPSPPESVAEADQAPGKRRFIGKFERTRISSCHQITIPRDAYQPAGFEVGDKLEARCVAPGKVLLERIAPATSR